MKANMATSNRLTPVFNMLRSGASSDERRACSNSRVRLLSWGANSVGKANTCGFNLNRGALIPPVITQSRSPWYVICFAKEWVARVNNPQMIRNDESQV